MSYAGGFRDRISILLKSTDTREVQYSIEAPGVAYYYNGSLSAGGEVILNLPRTLTVTSYNDQDKGIYLKVYSDSVTVIGQNLDRRTGDSFFALPIIELDDVIEHSFLISNAFGGELCFHLGEPDVGVCWPKWRKFNRNCGYTWSFTFVT